jgi:hypothetical protein
MTSPNATFTELVASTLRNHPGAIADNVSKNNALYARLKKRGRIKLLSGGYEIIRPLDYAENATYQRYSGYETLNVQASDVISAARYDWKQAAVHVTASGLEMRQNSGRERIIDLAAARTKNAMRTMANNLSVDMYSLGTADGGKQVGGLQQIITQDGTGTVGGIDAATFTFWKNKFKDLNSATADTIGVRMHDLWMELVRGTDKPDMIVSSNELYSLYWDGLTDLQRYSSKDEEATMGFMSLKFQSADIFHDGGSGIPANTMYFLNTDYLELVAHKDANLTTLDEKVSVNQDAVVIPILFQGNLCCSNRSLQGVAFD